MLEGAVEVLVDWFLDDGGWAFKSDRDDATTKDKLFGYDRLRHVYKKADSNLTARVTVPVLWDLRRKTILNNESREILRMFTTTFKPWHKEGAPDLCPEHLQEEIDRVAMEEGLAGSGDYLDQWEWTEKRERSGSAEEVIAALLQELEAQYDNTAVEKKKG